MNTANSLAQRSTPFQLVVRKQTRFDFSDVSEKHTADNRYISHFFNALSLVTPITEGILIRAIRKASNELDDELLISDARAFMGQEALHTREHRSLNIRLSKLGYGAEELITELEADVRKMEEDMSLREALALVVTGEHAIYSIARSLLDTPACAYEQDPEVRRLFAWHSLEEMEHQSVCDDIYRHLYGDGLKHKLFCARVFLKAAKLLGSMITKIMKNLIENSPPARRGEKREFIRWLASDPAVGARTLKELFSFFSPAFAHWRRERGDVELIRTNLAFVYGEDQR